MKIKALATSAFAAFLIAAGAYNSNAQSIASANDVPRTISYQGNLADNAGKALPDGSYRITLSLFADPAGSVKVWQDTYDALVINGIFNLYLGAGSNPLPDPARLNAALWIGTQVGDGPLMHPLTPLSASPYALNVPDRAITTGKLADGAVTADKVDMNYIAGVQINDRQIAGTGTVLKLKGSDAITLDYDETTNSVTIGAGSAIEKGASGDDEKGTSVLDNVDWNENWNGRTTPSNPLTFGTPLGSYNTLAGGFSNSIGASANHSTIPGGKENVIGASTHAAVIGGGEDNTIASSLQWPTIAGGHLNQIYEDHGFIGGGHINIVSSESGTIAGGSVNEVSGDYGFIGGGEENLSSGDHSAVAGGDHNYAASEFSFIGGGQFNITNEIFSSIGGGESNITGGTHATIGGGRYNDAAGNASTIPGGDKLKTTSYAQTAVGLYNAPRGSLTSPPTIFTNSDAPIFMVGNGSPALPPIAEVRSNAFEVSYNGHSVVYGQSSIFSPYRGATYVDNIIYAWGEINASGAIVSDFGVTSVTHTGPGTYVVRIEVLDPQTGVPITFAQGSVTATLMTEGEHAELPCYIIGSSKIGIPSANEFTIRVKDITGCKYVDAPFMFKVTGRPAIGIVIQ